MTDTPIGERLDAALERMHALSVRMADATDACQWMHPQTVREIQVRWLGLAATHLNAAVEALERAAVELAPSQEDGA